MRIHIVGNKGNMASRYISVLKHIARKKKTYIAISGHDVDSSYDPSIGAERFIICTPTETHLGEIGKHLFYGRPILCEKPISKDLEAIKDFGKGLDSWQLSLITMVNQYAYLASSQEGLTYYNYFKSGKDSIYWDCINIIGLSEGPVIVENTSPIWRCMINDQKLNLADIDESYVRMMEDWLEKPVGNWQYVLKAHEKVVQCLSV